MSALFLKERVRIYRWLAVIAGFVGILVMLGPHFDLSAHAGAAGTTLGLAFAIGGAFCNAGSVMQTTKPLTETETTSSIVFYFSLICALAGPRDLAPRLAGADLGRVRGAGDGRTVRRSRPHSAHRKLPPRARVRGGAIRLYRDGVISAGVATAAGILLAPVTLIDINMGLAVTLKAFAAAVLGGFGSIPGALVGGITIGLIELYAGATLPEGFKDTAPYIVLLVMLAVRPQGLFGTLGRKKV